MMAGSWCLVAQCGGEFGEIGDNEIGLMRRFAERAPAPVDERGAHAETLGADAVEGMVGNEQDA